MSPKKPQNNIKMPRFNLMWIFLLVIISLSYLLFQGNASDYGVYHKEVTYSAFKKYVESGYASKIEINKSEGIVTMYVKKEHAGKIFGKAAQAGADANVTATIPSVDNADTFIADRRQYPQFLPCPDVIAHPIVLRHMDASVPSYGGRRHWRRCLQRRQKQSSDLRQGKQCPCNLQGCCRPG